MSESIDSAAPLVLDNLGLNLQTTVPSAIRKHGLECASRSVATTLNDSQGRKVSTSVDPESPTNGWARIKHPDCGVYYVNREKRLYTSSDVFNPRVHSLIVEAADIFQRSSALQALLAYQDVGIVLDAQQVMGATKTAYYCVSHADRRIFWLEGIGHDQVDIPCTSPNKCMESKGLRAHCVEAQYWRHCELFPTTFTVTKDVTGELKDILLQSAADRLLVKFSTSPYDKDDLAYMLNVVKDVEADVREGSGYSSWIIARFMSLYNDGVLRSSYGQGDDYFDIENTGPSIGPYERPYLLAILAPFLLKSPDVYARELHSFHDNFTPARWSKFVHKVDQSIRDSNLLATVLLSTNMGLLSYSDDGKIGGNNSPSATQIIAYISIICSAGSIIIGLAIFKQYRAKGADTPLRAVVVLKRILKEPFGLERLAIICCLPYVLLMWSLIAFLAAFGIIFYQETGLRVRIPISVALFLVSLCLFFCLHTAGPPDKEDQKPLRRSREDRVAPFLSRFGSRKQDQFQA